MNGQSESTSQYGMGILMVIAIFKFANLVCRTYLADSE